VPQGVDTKFKPQYHQKKKRVNDFNRYFSKEDIQTAMGKKKCMSKP
jgi:hypothetical protein